MKNIIHTLCITTIVVYLTFSLAPDWAKSLVIDGIKMSERSIPFYMSIRFDKPLLGLFILFLFGFGFQPLKVTQVLKTGLINSFYVIALLIGVAISISYVEWDPKLPYETGLFMLNNLLIVCIAEEAIFRRYIQSWLYSILKKSKYKKALSILIASLIFGITHLPGGYTFVALATIAGVFYGWCYQKTGRIECSIICHFGLNAVHFLFFSYPALNHHI